MKTKSKKQSKKRNFLLPLFSVLTSLICVTLVFWLSFGNVKQAHAGLCINDSQCAYNENCRDFVCQHTYYCWHVWCDSGSNWCHGGYHFSNHKCVFDDVCGYNPQLGEHANGYVMYKAPVSLCPVKSSTVCLRLGGKCISGSKGCSTGTHEVGSCDIYHRTSCCVK